MGTILRKLAEAVSTGLLYSVDPSRIAFALRTPEAAESITNMLELLFHSIGYTFFALLFGGMFVFLMRVASHFGISDIESSSALLAATVFVVSERLVGRIADNGNNTVEMLNRLLHKLPPALTEDDVRTNFDSSAG